jgi:ATP-binding protein involved in chromosome partitioning
LRVLEQPKLAPTVARRACSQAQRQGIGSPQGDGPSGSRPTASSRAARSQPAGRVSTGAGGGVVSRRNCSIAAMTAAASSGAAEWPSSVSFGRRFTPESYHGAMPTRDQILEALKVVIDPELRRDIVELDMVRSIDIHPTGVVDVTVSLTTAGCPIRSHFQDGVRGAVSALEGVTGVNIAFDVLDDQQKANLQRKLGRPGGLPSGALAGVKNVICVGSGKGGVGKSSVTANLAAALAAEGKMVGVLDADVWGYSIPRMFGVGSDRPAVSPERKIIPPLAHGIKVMSIGFFLEQDAAVVWRGPMLHKALTQFLEDVAWGELDYLLVDLPPGTGDVSMTIAQLLPQARFLIVTTPQDTAQKVARRSAEMADKVNLEVAGIVENMSGFTTPDGQRFAIFGEGGGQALADELGVPLLGKVPLTMPLRVQADAGTPLVIEDPDDPAAQAIRQAARGVIAITPMAPISLPVLDVVPPGPPAGKVSGMSLPMAG